MITLHGIGVCKGMGIAEAALVGPEGLVPEQVRKRGIEAIKRALAEADRPEVVLVCETIESGLLAAVPGVKIAAIAAQSPDGGTCPDSAPPSVAGVQDLFRSVRDGDIVIVDGARGVVCVDPDAQTLAHYQTMEEQHKTRRIFLESIHLPAVTQTGKTVKVFAALFAAEDISSALAEGADGLLLLRHAVEEVTTGQWERILYEAAGKPFILLSTPLDEALAQIMSMSFSGEVTIVLPSDDEPRLADLQSRLSGLYQELTLDDIEPGEVAMAIAVTRGEDLTSGVIPPSVSRLVIDAAACAESLTQDELAECITDVVAGSEEAPLPATVMLSSSIDAVRYLLLYGVDSVAVPLGFISATKDLIRSFPTPE